MEYTQQQKSKDFDFFKKNNLDFFKKYGHKYIAIKDQSVIGTAEDVQMLIAILADKHPVGTYIIQECTGDDTGYTLKAMRFIINANKNETLF